MVQKRMRWGGLASANILLVVSQVSGSIIRTGDNGTQYVGIGEVYGDYDVIGMNGVGSLEVNGASALTGVGGILGSAAGSSGTATVTGSGSSWSNASGLWVGDYGFGNLAILNGGQVSNHDAKVGKQAGSVGSALVSGRGSQWTGYTLAIGYSGRGSVAVDNGGSINSSSTTLGYSGGTGTLDVNGTGSFLSGHYMYLGYWAGDGSLSIRSGAKVETILAAHIGAEFSNSTGRANVTGIGSEWVNSYIYVGRAGRGSLAISDAAKVTAYIATDVTAGSTLRLQVSGDNMLVVGRPDRIGDFTNNGIVELQASAMLPSGTYRPISEYAGRSLNWTGTGLVQAVGGTWNAVDRTFTVAPAEQVASGAVAMVGSGSRLRYAGADGRDVGISFGSSAGPSWFWAGQIGEAGLTSLVTLSGGELEVLGAWNFTTDYSGTDALLSFDVGTGVSDLEVWHYSDGVWSQYSPAQLVYDSGGIASFAVSSFSGYAVLGIVPEPGLVSVLLAVTLPSLLYRRSRKESSI